MSDEKAAVALERGQTPEAAERLRRLRELGDLPVRIDEKGRVFIGDDEFIHPIIKGSISFSRSPRERHGFNVMTVSLIVGDVTMEGRKAKS